MATRQDEGRRGFVSRRKFIAQSAAVLAAPYFVPASVLGADGRPSPSERIGIGVIGLGSRGTDHTNAFLYRGETQVVAVCDPFQSKCDATRKRVEDHYAARTGAYKGCSTHRDYRELLARPDVDAVVIASPENWHAIQGADAVRAGKDVYGEKALSLTIAEGRALCQAVRRHGAVYQVGTQQRSGRNFRFAAELARNGYLGKLHTVQVAVPGGRPLPNAEPKPVPPDLDYEMWLGPAPWRPYNDVMCTFNWYFISDFCAGWIQSWGVHHVDSALWGAPSFGRGRIEVEGTADFPRDGLADTSVTWDVEVRSADGLRMRFSDDARQRHGVRFEGSQGWVHVDRGGIWAEPASLLSVVLKPSDEHLYVSNDHHGNFLECIRTRRDPVAPVEAGHAATVLTLVCDIATRLGRKVVWDWNAEGFVGCDEASAMTRRSMRAPWNL